MYFTTARVLDQPTSTAVLSKINQDWTDLYGFFAQKRYIDVQIYQLFLESHFLNDGNISSRQLDCPTKYFFFSVNSSTN